MTDGLSRRTLAAAVDVGGEARSVKEEGRNDQVVVLDEDDMFRAKVAKLRGRWELASVLNFLTVFESVIGNDLKMSAEDVEMGLIKPNNSLARLHIALLKGIPPASKTLNVMDAWVTVLCKKLAMWWPWVAEGVIPLIAAKGEEITKYKELDPTNRLLILKALCEIRANQDDTVSFINDSLKEGTQISCFRKSGIGRTGNGASFWFDGNAILGYRLYREVITFEPAAKVKVKGCLTLPSSVFQWETIATSIEELRKVADKLLSSKVVSEVGVGKSIEADAIPVLERLQKKKEKALKRKQREEMLINGFRRSATGITRSCRNRRPVSYTFDDYDRAINEAIQLSKKRSIEDERLDGKQDHKEIDVNATGGACHTATKPEDDSGEKGESGDNNHNGNDMHQEIGPDDDAEDKDYDSKENKDDDYSSDSCNSNEDKDSPHHSQKNQEDCNLKRHMGVRWSKRLEGNGISQPVSETTNLGTKKTLRQRPILNSAIIPVSDDENCLTNANSRELHHHNLSTVACSDEVSGC